jgi:hypothetical protein
MGSPVARREEFAPPTQTPEVQRDFLGRWSGDGQSITLHGRSPFLSGDQAVRGAGDRPRHRLQTSRTGVDSSPESVTSGIHSSDTYFCVWTANRSINPRVSSTESRRSSGPARHAGHGRVIAASGARAAPLRVSHRPWRSPAHAGRAAGVRGTGRAPEGEVATHDDGRCRRLERGRRRGRSADARRLGHLRG